MTPSMPKITLDDIKVLENEIDKVNKDLPILHSFAVIIPGQLGPIKSILFLFAYAFAICTSFTGAPSVITIASFIPELAASVAASLKKHNDLAIGNLIGSNIFNLLVVIGITSAINPITGIDFNIISKDMIWVVAFSVLLLPLVYLQKRNKFNRIKGIILLAMYIAYIFPLIS